MIREFSVSPAVQFLSDHAVIAPSQSLRGKAAIRVSPIDRVDQDRLERAEKALSALARFFPNWMDEELNRLSSACEFYLAAPEDGRQEALQKLMRSAYNLRGNAQQFGYPVAARVAERLSALLTGKGCDHLCGVVLQGHTDAIRSILRFGAGEDPTAIEIENALERLVAKHARPIVRVDSLARS